MRFNYLLLLLTTFIAIASSQQTVSRVRIRLKSQPDALWKIKNGAIGLTDSDTTNNAARFTLVPFGVQDATLLTIDPINGQSVSVSYATSALIVNSSAAGNKNQCWTYVDGYLKNCGGDLVATVGPSNAVIADVMHTGSQPDPNQQWDIIY